MSAFHALAAPRAGSTPASGKSPKLALSFVHDRECSACREMLPEVEKFAAANADLVDVKITDVREKAGDFPSATVPAVKLTLPDGKGYVAEAKDKPAILSAVGLESWVAGHVERWARRER